MNNRFKLIESLSNYHLHSLRKVGNHIIYRLGDTTYLDNKSFTENVSVYNFSVFDNDLYVSYSNRLWSITNGLSREILFIPDTAIIELVKNNLALAFKRKSEVLGEYCFYDLKATLRWSHITENFYNPVGEVIISSHYLDDTKFTVLNLKTGTPLWDFRTDEGFKKQGTTHLVWDTYVLTQVKPDRPINKRVTLGLDIHTGDILWKSKKQGSHIYHLSEQDSMLYGFGATIMGNNSLWILNPKDGYIEEINFKNFKGDVSPYLATIHDNRLYFTDNRIGCGLGVIDLASREMIYHTGLGLKEGIKLYQPEIYEGKLYVAGTDRVLRVFHINDKDLLT